MVLGMRDTFSQGWDQNTGMQFVEVNSENEVHERQRMKELRVLTILCLKICAKCRNLGYMNIHSC